MNRDILIILVCVFGALIVGYFMDKKSSVYNELPIVKIMDHSMVDDPFEIVVKRLQPGSHIMLQTSCEDWFKNKWVSHAAFEADPKGEVNITTQAPISGSYSGIDSCGLLWSMLPEGQQVSHFWVSGDRWEVNLEIKSGEAVLAQKTIYRLLRSSKVERRDVRENGLVGTLFYPENGRQAPGIIVVPGSNGGIPEALAQVIASHEYTVFALAYFGEEGLPEGLENINLEYFEKAFVWLKNQPCVKVDSIGLIGASRGGELALLLASTFPKDLQAVVAYVPNSVVYGGIPHINQPAWQYKNKPVQPYLLALTSTDLNLTESEDLAHSIQDGLVPLHANIYDDPCVIADAFLAKMRKNPDSFEQAAIPVEKITCPLLIFSGGQDAIWPSALYAQRIMNRLDAQKSQIFRKHCNFENAGHGFWFPNMPEVDLPIYHPVAKLWCRLGGTTEANAHANQQSWQELLNFLHEKL